MKVLTETMLCGGCGAEEKFRRVETIGIISACCACGWPGASVIKARTGRVRSTQDMVAPGALVEEVTKPDTPSKLRRPSVLPAAPSAPYSTQPGTKERV